MPYISQHMVMHLTQIALTSRAKVTGNTQSPQPHPMHPQVHDLIGHDTQPWLFIPLEVLNPIFVQFHFHHADQVHNSHESKPNVDTKCVSSMINANKPTQKHATESISRRKNVAEVLIGWQPCLKSKEASG